MAFANGQVASIGITLHVRSQIHTLLILHLLFFLSRSFQNPRCLTLSRHILTLKLLISYMTPVFIFFHSKLGGLLLAFSLLFPSIIHNLAINTDYTLITITFATIAHFPYIFKQAITWTFLLHRREN